MCWYFCLITPKFRLFITARHIECDWVLVLIEDGLEVCSENKRSAVVLVS